ncbi:hypothetical protein [Nocardioides massiliensis]|uniref:Flp pilus assembly pilin Flp n=1 Tax=Nocardioides massiliensis TaxID=1325935 RepID=A0ABT9NLG0_9ACTN|nr:hypothetical protein [Nocardioides massiliensis]MDP9820655.1 Flp pilus assembly pilin Flp [Nocardioides massiliensis]
MLSFSPTHPVGFLMMLAAVHHDRARRAERGASAVEWVIIAAIVAAIAIAIGAVLRGALTDKAGQIGEDIGGAGG